MTKKERLKKLHQELWQWLADHPEENKWDWPKWKENGGRYKGDSIAHCFACAYSKDPVCKDCPCDWGEGRNCEHSSGTIFTMWRDSYENNEERTKYALLIKDAWK